MNNNKERDLYNIDLKRENRKEKLQKLEEELGIGVRSKLIDKALDYAMQFIKIRKKVKDWFRIEE